MFHSPKPESACRFSSSARPWRFGSGSQPLFAALLVGTFAIFHGHAHGAEMPVDASGLGYALGFLLATALLHAIGIGIGVSNRLLTESSARRLTRAGGAALALAGVGLVLNLA